MRRTLDREGMVTVFVSFDFTKLDSEMHSLRTVFQPNIDCLSRSLSKNEDQTEVYGAARQPKLARAIHIVQINW